MKRIVLFAGVVLGLLSGKAQGLYHEQYRPQVHFTPKAHWINDPNGLVYYKGVYHLFFQYYPNASSWGPMHWGHATSTDLMHWKEGPIALYPDSLGYIFSGSAVADLNNTSGFGTPGHPPLVAIFTHHDPEGDKAHRDDFERQSIAYSVDEGKTWTKYAGNPVVKNPGVRDFRDPKVMWYAPTKKWIMTVSAQDRVLFYSSPNLKDWTKESEFGKTQGSHGGVFECPDLFALPYKGENIWVLAVNIGGGNPNGGNGTQYFTGKFDGRSFVANDTAIKWLDRGRDDYAGVTWSNTGKRRIFIGWMVNGEYAGSVPTNSWRSGMTLPRELRIDKVNGQYLLVTKFVKELSLLEGPWKTFSGSTSVEAPFEVKIGGVKNEDFAVTLSNDAGEKTVVGYDAAGKQWYVDRTAGGKSDFHQNFAGKHVAPRFAARDGLMLLVDVASIELIADGGLTVMSTLVFPVKPYNKVEVSKGSASISTLKGIW